MTKNKRVTIFDVAKAADVSTATVSRVINNKDIVLKETADLVRNTIKEIGYIPKAAARNLARNKTNTIGVVLREIGEEFSTQILRGIEAFTLHTEYDLLISTHQADDGGDWLNLPIGPHNTDGLIALTGCLSKEEIYQLYNADFPFILLYEFPPDSLPIPSIHIENRYGTQQLIDHMIQVHGSKRFAFLQGPPNNLDSEQRLQGLRESLAKFGLSLDPDLIGFGDFSQSQSNDVVRDWIRHGKKMDVIFGGSDEGAIGALMALKAEGVSVPDEIAVVGFDDMTLVRYLTPPLTTVHAPIERIGNLAVENIIQMINHEEIQRTIILPTRLVIRQSCGCTDEN